MGKKKKEERKKERNYKNNYSIAFNSILKDILCLMF